MFQQVSADTYTDFTGLNNLKLAARQDPAQALQGIARQFEGVFLHMVLKSMRQANFGDPYFNSNQTQFYQEMFDHQIALSMSQRNGIGLADALVKQLQRYIPNSTKDKEGKDKSTDIDSNGSSSRTGLPVSRFTSKQDFIEQLMPLAKQAAEELGVDAGLILSQAAIETGWGKFVARNKGGRASYNLFNIKADSSWKGNHIVKNTLEVIDGVTVKQKARFRVYDSYAESFNDYDDFLKSNPRYKNAIQQNSAEGFITALQEAGYATDPQYARKILNVFETQVSKAKLAHDNRYTSLAAPEVDDV